MDTKELILHTATNLFNQHGTAKISTNAIADAAGISSGNLYYHYKDKSHIIREIYEQMIKSWEKPYDRAENRSMSIETFTRFIEENFELLWEYRFFYRETVALLNADPALKERQTEIIKQRFERQLNILQQAEKDGIFHFPEPDVRLDEVLTIVWIVANNYLVHLESMGQVVEYRDFEKGTELILKVLHPYIVHSPNPSVTITFRQYCRLPMAGDQVAVVAVDMWATRSGAERCPHIHQLSF